MAKNNFDAPLPRADALAGPLTPADTSWLCPSGFATETQTWYLYTADNVMVMVQVIHSAVGLWYPQIQFTFRLYDARNADAPKHAWRSVSVSDFVSPPPGLDKRSSRSSVFTITLDPNNPDVYTIAGAYDKDVQVDLNIKRLVSAVKLGSGPQGGVSYFGKPRSSSTKSDVDITSGQDGFCVHRFWPQTSVQGVIRVGNEVLTLDPATTRGNFIHAIQGMRPNLVASRWNFCHFQSFDEHHTSLTMMEFTTPSNYGSKVVNVGIVCTDDKLVAVTANGDDYPEANTKFNTSSSALHQDTLLDPSTGYKAPGKILFHWAGPRQDVENGRVDVELPVTFRADGKDCGLIEKVDVLAQIPYLLKKVVNVVAGTKPYIYTYSNKVTAKITLDGETRETEGYAFNEATFITEP